MSILTHFQRTFCEGQQMNCNILKEHFLVGTMNVQIETTTIEWHLICPAYHIDKRCVPSIDLWRNHHCHVNTDDDFRLQTNSNIPPHMPMYNDM